MSDGVSTAFYYPGWIWREPRWLKNMLLFFDQVAVLVPEYMLDAPEQADPVMVAGLREHGLLHLLSAADMLDQAATERLVTQMAELLSSGALDDLRRTDHPVAMISWSRLGHRADRELSRMLVEELEQRGLARASEDGVSVGLHPLVRSLILVLLSQILRRRGQELGFNLAPVTDLPNVHRALNELLGLPSLPSAGHVMSLDLEAVGIDLSAVSIEEILEFRAAHGAEYRAYARDLRATLRALGQLDPDEQTEALADRRECLADAAVVLREHGSRWWKTPASIALGIGGAAWTLTTGDVWGALVAAGAVGVSAVPDGDPSVADAHSYLMSARALP